MPADLAQRERSTLCDLFSQLGPDAPTLCEGWATADLAAHLVIRERRPDAGPGIVMPRLAAYTAKVQQKVRDTTPWPQLVERVRSGPPPLLRPFDAAMNTIEYFIHVADVERAQSGWEEPGPVSPELADALWARVGPGRLAKQVNATVVMASPGREPKQAGTGPQVTLSGDPGELILFGSGRQRAAKVTIEGDPQVAERLRNASLGI